MNVEIFTFCETAAEKNGQLSLLHTFSNMIAPTIPGRIVACVVVQVRFRPNEAGEHRTELVLVDNDGEERWRCTYKVALAFTSRDETFAYQTITPMVADVCPGQHDIRLLVDGRELAAIPLMIIGPKTI